MVFVKWQPGGGGGGGGGGANALLHHTLNEILDKIIV